MVTPACNTSVIPVQETEARELLPVQNHAGVYSEYQARQRHQGQSCFKTAKNKRKYQMEIEERVNQLRQYLWMLQKGQVGKLASRIVSFWKQTF